MDMDVVAHESLSVKARHLNAFTLNRLSAVHISWTVDVSRHMLLAKTGGRYVLELFSLPCALKITQSIAVGIPKDLALEIEESYALLFNAWPPSGWHWTVCTFIGFHRLCLCWACSARRHRDHCIQLIKSVSPERRRMRKTRSATGGIYDPYLEELTLKTPHLEADWTPEQFPYLWLRIMRLEQHLHTSRPWSLWVLFRDRRDTMQFWTFL